MAVAARGCPAHLRVRHPRQPGHRRVRAETAPTPARLASSTARGTRRLASTSRSRSPTRAAASDLSRSSMPCSPTGRLIVTGSGGGRNGNALTLVKDPRGADPGGAPAYHLPAGHSPCAARAASRRRWCWRWRRSWRTAPTLLATRTVQGAAADGRRRHVDCPVRPGHGQTNLSRFSWSVTAPRRGVRPLRQHLHDWGDGEHLHRRRHLVFDIVHEDWGESDPPTFRRNIVARVVQNEMIAGILGKNLVIDPANPPARPAGRGFTLVGPIAPRGREETVRRASTSGDPVPAPPSSRHPAERHSGRRAQVDRTELASQVPTYSG